MSSFISLFMRQALSLLPILASYSLYPMPHYLCYPSDEIIKISSHLEMNAFKNKKLTQELSSNILETNSIIDHSSI